MGICCSNHCDKNAEPCEPLIHISPIQNNSVLTFSQNDDYSRTVSHNLTSNPNVDYSKQEKEKQINLELQQNINNVITSFRNFNIKKITIGDIWNISKYYLNDFTLSHFIVYDFRGKEFKNENFLKKYKCISYTIENIEMFSSDRINLFHKFLSNKTVIIIPENEHLENTKRFITCLNQYNITNVNIKILDIVLHEEMLITNEMYYSLYKRFDDSVFHLYPNILLPLRRITYLDNPSFIFVDKLSQRSMFHKEKLINLNEQSLFSCATKETQGDFNNKECNINYGLYVIPFLHEFRIKIILSLTCSNKTNNNNMIEIITLSFYVYFITINCNEFVNNNGSNINVTYLSQFVKVINLIKSYIVNQCGLLILYDDSFINEDVLIKIFSYLCAKLFHRDFSYNTFSGMFTTIFKESIMLHLSNLFLEKFTNAFQESCDLLNSQKFLFLQNPFINNLSNAFKNLFDSIPQKSEFFSIINFIERIILNILNHQHNSIFYKVKKDSRSFQNKIGSNNNAKLLLQCFSFQENKDYFYLKEDTDISILQEKYDYLLYYVKYFFQ